MTDPFLCKVCQTDALEEFDEFRSLPLVTSDSKPWPAGGRLSVCTACGAIQKLPDEKWRRDAAEIYKYYEMYHLSRGAEQLVFADVGEAKPRSQRLVEFVVQKAKPNKPGHLIDIGCGNGEALGNFSRALPDWTMFGSELTDKVRPELRRLTNFSTLYTVPASEIPGRFAIVTMIHSLEHMPEPKDTLCDAAGLLEADGTLFVEVPDVETSPFDLLVADHMMHFSRATLGALAGRAGVAVTTLINNLAPKEITLLGHRGTPKVAQPVAAEGINIARNTVRWLTDVVAQVGDMAKDGPIGIFGTSVAAMAVYGAFRDRVAFFVDEDKARIGKSYDGKPVVSPAQAPAGRSVFVALPPDRADRVVERLAAMPSSKFVAPPPLTVTAR